MSNQYEVLGKAPGAEDLKKLSPKDIHLTILNKRQIVFQKHLYYLQVQIFLKMRLIVI